MSQANVTKEEKASLSGKFFELRQICKERQVSIDILQLFDEIESLLLEYKVSEPKKISAQFSLYPLRQPKLSPIINKAYSVLKTHGLKYIPGSMSSLIIGDENAIWKGLKAVFSSASKNGEIVMVVTFSNACPVEY